MSGSREFTRWAGWAHARAMRQRRVCTSIIATSHPLLPQILVYFSYMSIFISGLYFAMGAVGFLSSGVFVFAIMRAVKAE